MPQTENEEGRLHKKLGTANGSVNLPIPPEKPDTQKKAIPARAKRTATQKAPCAGSERVRKTARVGKASSVVDKSVAKAAPPAIPAGAKTLPANTEKPAGEPAIVSKSFAVVIVTRASSRGIIRKDKSPSATTPEAEGPIREIVNDEEDKSSTSSESEDDLEKDGNYAPVAPRKRRVARKGKARVASRKRAAPNTSLEQAIIRATTTPTEIGSTLTKEYIKPPAGHKSRGRRNGNAPETEATAQKEAGPLVAPGAKTLPANTEKPAGEPAIVSRSVDVIVTRASSRGIIRKVKSPTDTAPEAEGPIREIVTDEEDKSSTSSESGDDLEKDGNYAPVAPRKRRVARKGKAPVTSRKRAAPNMAVAPPEHKKKRVYTPEVRAAVPQEAGPPAAPEADSTLTAEKPTPAPTTDSLRGEIAVPEQHAPPAAVSETPVGSVEAATPATTSAPPLRVRGPRYRIPAEGSRKSTRIKAQHDKLE
ncbi:hypothetical protein B9Z19DRAFT_1154920 [Tuber borchii]|uniref:Uncharacterized protein n=1 Tax=Tuber borchii TaxID=42251 RepID=A0A2T6ZI35_TUBBO|nr:hypothetical protein B9Z19DRAFT_1154920 [Tuber borchii]